LFEITIHSAGRSDIEIKEFKTNTTFYLLIVFWLGGGGVVERRRDEVTA